MKEKFHMIAVLSIICAVCALALAFIRDSTAERIVNQKLKFLQGPAVERVLQGAENDLIGDRKTISVGGEEIQVFIARKGGAITGVAFELSGGGFGGDIAVMTGFELEGKGLTGIQIVGHSETPGIGSKVTEDPFTGQFKSLTRDSNFALKGVGGDVDCLTGATYSSKGVCEALRKCVEVFPEVKKQIRSE